MFPEILTNWVYSIPDTDTAVQDLAEKEGWILQPDNKNIDEPLATYE